MLRNLIADFVDALYSAGFHNPTIIVVRGLLKALDRKEQLYFMEIGQKVMTEVKLDMVCVSENATAEAVAIIH